MPAPTWTSAWSCALLRLMDAFPARSCRSSQVSCSCVATASSVPGSGEVLGPLQRDRAEGRRGSGQASLMPLPKERKVSCPLLGVPLNSASWWVRSSVPRSLWAVRGVVMGL